MPGIGLQYLVGVDGISLWLVLLTTFLFPVSVLASWTVTTEIRRYMVAMLVLETAVLGSFLALDLILFFIFFEAILVPMYLLIGGWGGERRVYAALKFFLFTMAGSAFLLVAIIFLYARAGRHHLRRARADRRRGDAAGRDGALVVPGVLRGLRGEGAGVPAAHVAARRAHRGADRRVGAAGRRLAEGRGLRPDPLQHGAVPRGLEAFRDRRSWCWR